MQVVIVEPKKKPMVQDVVLESGEMGHSESGENGQF